MSYHEVRVRPVVRYIITEFTSDENGQSSTALGEFENVRAANRIGELVANSLNGPPEMSGKSSVVFEPARALKIDWIRDPGEPKEAIRWQLSES